MVKGKPRTKVSPNNERHPRSCQAGFIRADKKPRREFTPQEPDGKLIVLFSRIDTMGPWCLTNISKPDHLTLLVRIRSFETMTVNQVFSNDGQVGKDYDIDRLPTKEARDRLLELELDDRDTISRLQIGGKQRLYGFREGSRFYAIWWDPDHKIWPSVKKNT